MRKVVIGCSVATLLVGICGSIAVPQWLLAMKRSSAKRRMADVTAIACAIERYRAREGRLPRDASSLVPSDLAKLPDEGGIRLSPTGYTVSEAVGNRQLWEVSDGKWRTWPEYVPKDWIAASEVSIAACREPGVHQSR